MTTNSYITYSTHGQLSRFQFATHFESRVSNPSAASYFHFRMPFESSNFPGPIFPD